MKKIIAFSIILVAFTAGAFAQSTDTESTTATATIVGPLALTKVSDMNFGIIAVNATAGTVILATDATRTTTGGAALVPSTPVAASFTVAGEASRTFSITLPADGVVTLAGGLPALPVNGFNHSIVGAPALSTSGAAAFTVGATLTVAASQAPGTYTSAPFDVTVNYN